MPSDAERFRFLADHELSVVWYDSGASISWREKWPEPGKTAGYVLLCRAKTLEEAIDSVIERWERKHKALPRETTEPKERHASSSWMFVDRRVGAGAALVTHPSHHCSQQTSSAD